jgi:hypothetical protein
MEIPIHAKYCPYCRKALVMTGPAKFGLIVILGLVALGILGSFVGKPEKQTQAAPEIIQPDVSAPITKPFNTDSISTYAVCIGRAAGCGIDTGPAMKRIGQWLDTSYTGTPQGKSMQMIIFAEGVKLNAENQSQGKSPDTCEQVKSAYNSMIWP